MPSVLTVILNYKTPEMTLESLEAAVAAMECLTGEIVVVDNDSGDGSYEAISREVTSRGLARVRVLQSGRNGGFGAGNNHGIRAGFADGSRPDYIYILNSDAFPAKRAISELLDYLESHPEADFAGSYIHGPDGEAHQTCFRFPSVASEFEGAARTGPISRLLKNYVVARDVPRSSGKVDWLAGASVMMRQSTLDRIGLFDETFFLYYEETDLCRRLARAGGEVHFVRESEVAHIGSVSTGMKTWKRVPPYWFESRWYYFRKNHGLLYSMAATLAQVLGTAILGIRRLVSRKEFPRQPHFLRDMLNHDLRAVFSRN